MGDGMNDRLDNLRAEYADLCTVPEKADGRWFQRRGYKFEQLLNRLLTVDGLEPRTSYKTPGEQVDGSFFLNGSVFLVEAKWHSEPTAASTLYQFKGKIDGKLIGTIGVFVSMSGYSEDAVDALTLGKALNLILFDMKDMDAALIRKMGFKAILKRKLRHAAEEGVVYFPTEIDVISATDSRQDDIERLENEGILANRSTFSGRQNLLIVCEGDTDREIIAALVKRILRGDRSGRSIRIIPAMGKHAVPRVANAVRSINPSIEEILVVIDGDGDPTSSRQMLDREIGFDGWVASIPDPTIESWLGLDPKDVRHRAGSASVSQIYQDAIQQLDTDDLLKRDQSFQVFYSAIVGH